MSGDFHWDFPARYSEPWFRLHRGESNLWPLAINHALIADRWHSAYIRQGDVWQKPPLSEAS